MRSLVLLFIVLLPLCSIAQKITFDNGHILHDGVVYANYKLTGDKQPTIPIVGQSEYDPLPENPETKGEAFQDISISLPNGEEVMYIKARVLSSPQYFFLKYYYNIKVLGLQC